MWQRLKHGAYQGFIVIDQLLNWLLAPLSLETWADETFSSRCGRLGYSRYPYKVYRVIVDALFWPFQGPDHCWRAYQKELDRIQLPPAMRKVPCDHPLQ